jgi:hypothetical protein
VRAVATLSAGNIWAVGDVGVNSVEHILLEHWNGSSWTVIDGPALGTSTSAELDGVFAVSAKNVWAVGWESSTAAGQQTLIVHWNGKTWTRQPSPSPGPDGELAAVHLSSARSGWAVGSVEASNQHIKSLILRWNGTSWTRVASPSPDVDDDFTGVTATSAASAWAVGAGGSRIEDHALIQHWNGTKWTLVKTPKVGLASQLTGVSAASPSSVWAVGAFANGKAQAVQTLILRWNGKSWQRSASPNVGSTPTFNFLNAVVMTSALNGWAVGGHDPVPPAAGVENPLLLRWNGTAWKVVTGPSPAANAILSGVAASSAGSAWAVGTDTGAGAGLTLAWQCH